jgi:hypothetical protein
MDIPDLTKARKAQAKLIKQANVHLAGVGLVRKAGIFGLKVNVYREEDVVRVPSQVEGVPVHAVEVAGDIHALRVTGVE